MQFASYEENAESECERLVSEALKYDPENPEVHQTMASLRISQNRKDEALQALLRGYNLWAEIGTSLTTQPQNCRNPGPDWDGVNLEADEEKPDYGFRTNTAKLFLELEQHEHARQILEMLVQEHDSVAEVWYLLHLAAMPHDSEQALDAITQAKEVPPPDLFRRQIFTNINYTAHR